MLKEDADQSGGQGESGLRLLTSVPPDPPHVLRVRQSLASSSSARTWSVCRAADAVSAMRNLALGYEPVHCQPSLRCKLLQRLQMQSTRERALTGDGLVVEDIHAPRVIE